MIDAIAFTFQTGTQWVHLPEKSGNWRGVYNRLRVWALDGTWERVFTVLMAQDYADEDLAWERADRDTGEFIRQLRPLRWGLEPSWAKGLDAGAKMINARAETVAENPAFRRAFAKRRCLLAGHSPPTGWHRTTCAAANLRPPGRAGFQAEQQRNAHFRNDPQRPTLSA